MHARKLSRNVSHGAAKRGNHPHRPPAAAEKELSKSQRSWVCFDPVQKRERKRVKCTRTSFDPVARLQVPRVLAQCFLRWKFRADGSELSRESRRGVLDFTSRGVPSLNPVPAVSRCTRFHKSAINSSNNRNSPHSDGIHVTPALVPPVNLPSPIETS